MNELANYTKYRGKCLEFSQNLCNENPELTLVRGYYYCPIWNEEEQHWWCKDKEGNIIDPTKLQFPSAGNGIYREFDGTIICEECGKEFQENDEKASFHGAHAFCSYTCYGKCIGLL